MSARLKGRQRQARLLLDDLTAGAAGEAHVQALILVGSYARGHERLASDVDLMLLTVEPVRCSPTTGWFERVRPGSRLVRTASWGPVREQRYRLRSGLLVEIDVAPVSWLRVPLDPGTRRVLADGHRTLHDPHGLVAGAWRQCLTASL